MLPFTDIAGCLPGTMVSTRLTTRMECLCMAGDGETRPDWGKQCGVYSPHAPKNIRRGRQILAAPVQCNRPFGHEGNHMYSTVTDARLWEWTPCEVIR